MTRRRLWSLTALACALLALPSVPTAWRAVPLAGVRVAGAALETGLRRLPPPDPRAPPLAMAVAAILFGSVLLLRRRRRPVADVATGHARRGRSVPVIARRTGLSQDAIRDLLGGDPVVVSTAIKGKFFRRSRRAPTPEPGAFADELEERSFDARA